MTLIEKYGVEESLRILDEMFDIYSSVLDDDEEENKAYWLTECIKQLVANSKKREPVNGKINFTAIDFETATHIRMPCQLGIAVVRAGEIIEKKSWLIKPPGNMYDSGCMKVHGITEKDTESCFEFDALWPEIKPYFEQEVIVAHNMDFDLDVLSKVLEYYHLPDARILSGRCTKNIYNGRSLKDVTAALGITMDRHHEALSDTCACAQIFIEYLNGIDPDTLNYPERKKRRRLPDIDIDLHNIEYINLSGVRIDRDFFTDKKVVLSGEFRLYSDREILKALLRDNYGAKVVSSISVKTELFIIGDAYGDVKMRDVLALKSAGQSIQIIKQEQLYVILNQIE
jgi:DNA polymerase-3 subunit epsilon